MATIVDEQIKKALSDPWTPEEEAQLQREEAEAELQIISVKDILPPARNLRLSEEKENEEEFLQLLTSIKASGVIEPLIVKPAALDKFEIIAGSRRFKASQLAGLEEVPAIVKDVNELETQVIAISENMHRRDLNVIEKSHSLIKLYESAGYDTTEASKYLIHLADANRGFSRNNNRSDKVIVPDAFSQLARKVGLSPIRQWELLKLRTLTPAVVNYALEKALSGNKLYMLTRDSIRKKSIEEQKAIIDELAQVREYDARKIMNEVKDNDSPPSPKKRRHVDNYETDAFPHQYHTKDEMSWLRDVEASGNKEDQESDIAKVSKGIGILSVEQLRLPYPFIQVLQKLAESQKIDLGSYISYVLMYKVDRTRKSKVKLNNSQRAWYLHKNRGTVFVSKDNNQSARANGKG